MTVHENHRQRVRTKYEQYGLDIFEEYQVLELLLFYCIPRRDTNEIAHRLIDRFGTFGKVLDAPLKELEKVDGVGHSVALFLKLLRDTNRYYRIHSEGEDVILDTLDDCGAFLMEYFDGYKVEAVYMLGLDAKKKVLCCKEIERGSVNSSVVSIRNLVNEALTENVTSVVLAHNHPSGVALPSPEDVHTTQRVAQALHAIDVELADHIIIGERDYVSMALSGLYKPYKNGGIL